MKRRDVVQALLTPEPATPAGSEERGRVASGAVRAMGLEMDRLADDARAAVALRDQVESGSTILDLPTDLVDPSFVSDRLARTEDAEYRRLVESIRDTGQQVPILVRPHPEIAERYQIAYGHRRRDAAAELGRPVRAIVRRLSDAELVIAQGKENGERRDLSFIERALFAADLQRRGFDRPTMHGALGIQSAEMTRLLSVAAAIPEPLVRKIGPAPKAGRLRWLELARDLGRPGMAETVGHLLAQPSVQTLATDSRFTAVIDAIRAATSDGAAGGENLIDGRGVIVGRIERRTETVRITLYERAAPGLGALVTGDLQALISRYNSGHR